MFDVTLLALPASLSFYLLLSRSVTLLSVGRRRLRLRSPCVSNRFAFVAAGHIRTANSHTHTLSLTHIHSYILWQLCTRKIVVCFMQMIAPSPGARAAASPSQSHFGSACAAFSFPFHFRDAIKTESVKGENERAIVVVVFVGIRLRLELH